MFEEQLDISEEQALAALGISHGEWKKIQKVRKQGYRTAPEINDRPVLEAVDEYIETKAYIGRHAETTMEQYARVLKTWRAFLKKQATDMLTHQISPELVQLYLAGRGSPSSRNQSLAVIRAFCDWCMTRKYASSNPSRNTVVRYQRPEGLHKPAILSMEQAAQMCVLAQRTNYAERNYAIVITMLTTGARLGEVTRLQQSDIDFKAGKVRLFGKGGKERFVDFVAPFEEIIEPYLKHVRSTRRLCKVRPEHADHLFYVQHGPTRGKPISRRSIQDLVKRLVPKLGLPYGPEYARISAHALRHFYAVNRWLLGTDLVRLRDLLGHSSVETTMVYLRALADDSLGQQMDHVFPLTDATRERVYRAKCGGPRAIEEVDEQ